MLIRLFLFLTATLFLLSGCGNNYSAMQDFVEGAENEQSNDFPEELPSSDNISFKPAICSELSFENISWPKDVSNNELNAFALAMNISGSFEGHSGWSNLSNNFDGQGVSLGLFNQNLGQGSLQPLLITFRDQHDSKMKKFFSPLQRNSLQSMLSNWGSSKDGIKLSKAITNHSYKEDTSFLDDPQFFEEDSEGFSKASNNRNQLSVNWAVNNLYQGNNFKSDWKIALQNMAESPEFVSLQVAAAKEIHKKAVRYMKKYNLAQLRSYLFLFDVVVQNGGIPSFIESTYLAWARNNSTASETTRLKKLLEYRLTVVRPQYVADVRARKTALINGVGLVHGSQRDFSKEYCAPSWAAPTLP
jgi:hypothetical protein